MRSAPRQPDALVEVGCQQLLQRVSHTPVITPTGQAVTAVRTAAVKFNAGR
jgi:hypothetical protein